MRAVSHFLLSRCQHSLWRCASSVLLLSFLAGLLLSAPAPLPGAATLGAAIPATAAQEGAAQPQLLRLAARQPAALVRVIVQKQASGATNGTDAEQVVRQLGGVVLHDLHIIGAFAARLPAGAIPRLATHPAVRWISLDGAMLSANSNPDGGSSPPETPAANQYLATLRYSELAGHKAALTGQGIGVAVVDSGVSPDDDFSHLVTINSFNAGSRTPKDAYGHGTHVAGIIAGSGADSGGTVRGIAPGVTLISVKISDETGMAYESDTLAALQWIYLNRAAYNIRVVNLSINTAQGSSYHASPLDAGVEFLWFNGIVVVASAGNRAAGAPHAVTTAPANDPFIITVGATDEQGTGEREDDMLAPYSASGHTGDGFLKPEIVAPGSRIYSVLSRQSHWDRLYPSRVSPSGEYFRLSGTSMAAPMVAGAAALLLEAEPDLTPDQVKFRLLHTGSPQPVVLDGVPPFDVPYLDLHASLTSATQEAANGGIVPSFLLLAVLGDAIEWDSAGEESVAWESVNWNSVNWNSAVLEDEDAGAAGAAGTVQWSAPAWPGAGPVDGEPADTGVQRQLFLPLAVR